MATDTKEPEIPEKEYDEEVLRHLISMGMEEKDIKEAMDVCKDPSNLAEIMDQFRDKIQNETNDDWKEHGIEKNNTNIDKTVIKFPVQVFVRFRPLIKEETEAKHKELEFKTKLIKKTNSTSLNINDITKKVRQSAIKKKKKSKSDAMPLKKFKGFRSIIKQSDDNPLTFKQCILPSIDNIFDGFTVCAFAYGHTGSGKTHTILGYDDKQQPAPGMYRLTAEYICDKLSELNKDRENNQVLICCRFAELYQGKMRDLFGDLVECHVREDDDGNINIRGPTIKDDKTGKVSVQPLTPIYIKQNESNKLIGRVKEALQYRNTGSSTMHDESSRSHCFLEMELVTNDLITEREKLLLAEADIVPVGKARDDMKIEMDLKVLVHDPETGQYKINPDWKASKEDSDKLDALQKETDRLQGIIDTFKENIRNIMNNNENKCIGGTVVFVDLAGNEYGADAKKMKSDSNVQLSERKEINKSLLALKECVRALHSHKSHVPYRDSKLTMVLRPHLKGMNSTAIMIANVSPSQEHVNKTFNTLLYSQLVAKA